MKHIRAGFGFGENSIENEKQNFLFKGKFIYSPPGIYRNENGKFNFHENIPVIQAFL